MSIEVIDLKISICFCVIYIEGKSKCYPLIIYGNDISCLGKKKRKRKFFLQT